MKMKSWSTNIQQDKQMSDTKLYWPTQVSTGKIFPKTDGAQPKDIRGNDIDIDVWAEAELWSNGTLFAVVEGSKLSVRVDPSTVDYFAKRT
jgi:hypothetical protein